MDASLCYGRCACLEVCVHVCVFVGGVCKKETAHHYVHLQSTFCMRMRWHRRSSKCCTVLLYTCSSAICVDCHTHGKDHMCVCVCMCVCGHMAVDTHTTRVREREREREPHTSSAESTRDPAAASVMTSNPIAGPGKSLISPGSSHSILAACIMTV